MKLKFSHILFFYLPALGQEKLSLYKESKIKIINLTVDQNPNNFPLLTFSLLNNTRKDIIFTKLLLNLHYFKKHPLSSTSNNKLESKELKPIGTWDLDLPEDVNTYLYTSKYPIKIASNDAATIQIRLFSNLKGKVYVPTQLGVYKFTLTFITYDNKGVQSSIISLGDHL